MCENNPNEDSCLTQPLSKWVYESSAAEARNWKSWKCETNGGCLSFLSTVLGKSNITCNWIRAALPSLFFVFFAMVDPPVPGSHSSRSSSSLGHSADATKISSEFCGWKGNGGKCVIFYQTHVPNVPITWIGAHFVLFVILQIRNVPKCSCFLSFTPRGWPHVFIHKVRALLIASKFSVG